MTLSWPPASSTVGRFLNREGLLPTREQIARAEQVVADYRQKMAASGNLTNLLFVTPDYYEERPKGCMGGWGSIFLSVTPEGTALPCHSARQPAGGVSVGAGAESGIDLV